MAQGSLPGSWDEHSDSRTIHRKTLCLQLSLFLLPHARPAQLPSSICPACYFFLLPARNHLGLPNERYQPLNSSPAFNLFLNKIALNNLGELPSESSLHTSWIWPFLPSATLATFNSLVHTFWIKSSTTLSTLLLTTHRSSPSLLSKGKVNTPCSILDTHAS